ncbi:MAG: hypothetical protein ACFBSC_01840 [Microcoleaceae cyanobacterium]
MSKRIYITLSDAVYEGLEELSLIEGTKPATLGSEYISDRVKDAWNSGRIAVPSKSKLIRKYRKLKHLLLDHRDDLAADARLGERVTQILNGDQVTELDRARLALFFNVLEPDIEALDEEMG